jgi:hypothetical protein
MTGKILRWKVDLPTFHLLPGPASLTLAASQTKARAWWRLSLLLNDMIFMRLKACSLAILVAAAISAWAREDTSPVALAATPAVVQKVINARVSGGKLESIEKSFEDGEITFDVDWTDQSGKEGSFTVAEDGTMLSVQVELSATPEAVQKTIQTQLNGSALKSLEKDVEDTNSFSYNAQVAKDGREWWFSVDEDGTLLTKEVTLEETPEPVQAAARQKAAGNPIKSIDESFDHEISYDVTTTGGVSGAESSFTVSASGVLLTEQVALEDVPPVVRKIVLERIGNGKIIRIDKTLSAKFVGVLPYVVRGRKSGKPFDFSVAPNGKFLGMDD